MTDHAKQPKLCADCEQVLHDMVKAENPGPMCAKYCEHHQTIGSVRVEDGKITGWYSESPLTFSEAMQNLLEVRYGGGR